MKPITRRDFLKLGGAGIAGTAAIGAGLRGWPLRAMSAAEREAVTGLEERWVASTCLQCPGGCSILVRVVNGRAVKIEGNPASPNNRGRICPKGQAGLQFLYDPDRIKGPLIQRGERGSDNWEMVSWEEAIRYVAEKLAEIREKDGPHTVIYMNGRNRGVMHHHMGAFFKAYGTPNDVGHGSICEDARPIAHKLTTGWSHYSGYDWENTAYVLSFGGSLLEAWRPTTHNLQMWGIMRRGHPGRRTKIVYIDPRFSVTAAKADEWLPIRPGTDGALAMAIAHVIIKEELYDKQFVAEHAFGFEDWTDEQGVAHMGFKTLALQEKYSPERVAQITDIPAETIVRIAREFATTRPALAAGCRGSSMQTNGVFNSMAIHALNALVGSIDRPGGTMIQYGPPCTPWPEPVLDEVAKQGLAMPRIDYAKTRRHPLGGKAYQDVPDNILKEEPYKINAVFFYYTNPFFSIPDVKRAYEAFMKVPFLVSFSPFMDEATAHCDVVLPDHTYLERWHDDIIYPSIGFPHWSIRQPVVEPLWDTQNAGDTIMQLAREFDRIAGTQTAAAYLDWQTMEDVLKYRARGVWEARRGNIVADTFEEWWQKWLEIGVWTDPPYEFGRWEKALTTPSGKFEFFSQTLKAELEKHANGSMDDYLAELKITARGDEVFMPHYEPPRYVGDEKVYPFHLIHYKVITHAEGRGANTPWLQEILGVHVQEAWDSWVEINPQTAKRLGIEDGDEVWVESPVGRVKTRAKLYPGARPDCVYMPYELGHRRYGRWARGRGAAVNEIVALEEDQMAGTTGWYSTRVRIYRA
ncbi:MAG: twin-arginine translocation signal domain-containing protein [Caldilineae bacterium]|nr:MAG: twin-arginine translocation signal domain-containing protein [Caldilineae bacterium]